MSGDSGSGSDGEPVEEQIRSRLNDKEQELAAILGKREELEQALDAAKAEEQRLQEELTAAHAEEGQIRHQLGELQNALAAIEE